MVTTKPKMKFGLPSLQFPLHVCRIIFNGYRRNHPSFKRYLINVITILTSHTHLNPLSTTKKIKNMEKYIKNGTKKRKNRLKT